MPVESWVPGFRPSQDAFQFTNSFPPAPAVSLDLGPAGTIGVGDASGGLCGGMVFAVRDLVEAGQARPDLTSPPAPDSPLFGYLVRRLLDSWDVPGGVFRYLRWMVTPDADTGVGPFRVQGVRGLTLREQWPHLRAALDAGTLSPIGLVTVHGADLTKVGNNHQVLAYGYVLDGDRVELAVYDPNTPASRADDVRIRFGLAAPAKAEPMTHTVNISHPIRGFFLTRYKRSRRTLPS
jgi:hypothetical protein